MIFLYIINIYETFILMLVLDFQGWVQKSVCKVLLNSLAIDLSDNSPSIWNVCTCTLKKHAIFIDKDFYTGSFILPTSCGASAENVFDFTIRFQ